MIQLIISFMFFGQIISSSPYLENKYSHNNIRTSISRSLLGQQADNNQDGTYTDRTATKIILIAGIVVISLFILSKIISFIQSRVNAKKRQSQQTQDRQLTQQQQQQNEQQEEINDTNLSSKTIQKGLAISAIEQYMPKLRFQDLSLMLKGVSNECAICLVKMEKNEEVRMSLCFHIFHDECFVDWFKDHFTCPCCRQLHKRAEFAIFKKSNIYKQNLQKISNNSKNFIKNTKITDENTKFYFGKWIEVANQQYPQPKVVPEEYNNTTIFYTDNNMIQPTIRQNLDSNQISPEKSNNYFEQQQKSPILQKNGNQGMVKKKQLNIKYNQEQNLQNKKLSKGNKKKQINNKKQLKNSRLMDNRQNSVLNDKSDNINKTRNINETTNTKNNNNNSYMFDNSQITLNKNEQDQKILRYNFQDKSFSDIQVIIKNLDDRSEKQDDNNKKNNISQEKIISPFQQKDQEKYIQIQNNQYIQKQLQDQMDQNSNVNQQNSSKNNNNEQEQVIQLKDNKSSNCACIYINKQLQKQQQQQFDDSIYEQSNASNENNNNNLSNGNIESTNQLDEKQQQQQDKQGKNNEFLINYLEESQQQEQELQKQLDLLTLSVRNSDQNVLHLSGIQNYSDWDNEYQKQQ